MNTDFSLTQAVPGTSEPHKLVKRDSTSRPATNLVGVSHYETAGHPVASADAARRKAAGIHRERTDHSFVAHDTATVPPARQMSGITWRALLLPVRPTAKYMAREIPAPIGAVIVGGLAMCFPLWPKTNNRRGHRLHA